MLKFLLCLFFLVPCCFYSFWCVQNILFFLSFLFMISLLSYNYYYYFSYFISLDLISWGFILLSFWICALMILSSSIIYFKKMYSNLFLLNVIFLMIFLFLTFSATNLLMFYIFFESSLIPLLFLIIGWGYQPERLQAGIYLLFYTLMASLPLLVCIMYIDSLNFSVSMYFIFISEITYMMYLSLILAFLVKLPMYLVHLWLPKAHVEAPVSGSMALAGVLLKLGGYGLFRVNKFLQEMCLTYSCVIISISLLGGIIISFICLRQTDLKMLVAYSSVSHMGLVLSGMMILNNWGLMHSYSLMLAHGLCSSGLFCLVNILYERFSSRNLLILRGILSIIPQLSLWWFMLSICNMAAPPSLNLLGEIGLINSIISWSWLSMLSLVFISFLGASYTLYFYSYSQHGKFYSGIYSWTNFTLREIHLLLLHWLPLNLIILNLDFLFII
nr:NADH dehydrogenase subunit 4 [Systropus sp. 2 YXA-2022a]